MDTTLAILLAGFTIGAVAAILFGRRGPRK